jgi:hypothetical protein
MDPFGWEPGILMPRDPVEDDCYDIDPSELA